MLPLIIFFALFMWGTAFLFKVLEKTIGISYCWICQKKIKEQERTQKKQKRLHERALRFQKKLLKNSKKKIETVKQSRAKALAERSKI